MSHGKMCSQASHASLKVFLDKMEEFEDKNGVYLRTTNITSEIIKWKNGIFTKIVLKCYSEGEILDLEIKAKELDIPHAVIIDVGKTEFNGVPTITCIALGPDKACKIDEITSSLKLL
jgi:PTH2 family peptidyl-tRNA hydrolase